MAGERKARCTYSHASDYLIFQQPETWSLLLVDCRWIVHDSSSPHFSSNNSVKINKRVQDQDKEEKKLFFCGQYMVMMCVWEW